MSNTQRNHSNNTNAALEPLAVETERETASSREEGEPDISAISSLPTQQQIDPNNGIDNRSNDIKEEIQASEEIGGSQHENQGKHDTEEEQLLNYPSTHCRMEFDLQAATTSLSQVSMSTPSFCSQQFEDKNGSNGNENDNDTYQVDPSDISSLTHLEEYNDNDLNNLLPFSTPMLTETPRNTTADTELLSPDNCSDSSSSSESTRLLSPPLSPGPPNSSKHKTSRKDSNVGVRFQSEIQIIDGNVHLFDQQQQLQQQQQQQQGTLLWYSSEELTRMRERRIDRSSSSLTTATAMSPTCHLICNVLYKCIACQRE